MSRGERIAPRGWPSTYPNARDVATRLVASARVVSGASDAPFGDGFRHRWAASRHMGWDPGRVGPSGGRSRPGASPPSWPLAEARDDLPCPGVHRSQQPGPCGPCSSQGKHASDTHGRRGTIGPGIRIEGKITGDADLRIEGRFEGSVELRLHAVTVGPEGNVHTTIVSRSVTVEGRYAAISLPRTGSSSSHRQTWWGISGRRACCSRTERGSGAAWTLAMLLRSPAPAVREAIDRGVHGGAEESRLREAGGWPGQTELIAW